MCALPPALPTPTTRARTQAKTKAEGPTGTGFTTDEGPTIVEGPVTDVGPTITTTSATTPPLPVTDEDE